MGYQSDYLQYVIDGESYQSLSERLPSEVSFLSVKLYLIRKSRICSLLIGLIRFGSSQIFTTKAISKIAITMSTEPIIKLPIKKSHKNLNILESMKKIKQTQNKNGLVQSVAHGMIEISMPVRTFLRWGFTVLQKEPPC